MSFGDAMFEVVDNTSQKIVCVRVCVCERARAYVRACVFATKQDREIHNNVRRHSGSAAQRLTIPFPTRSVTTPRVPVRRFEK